jgi:hypothetical protein
MLDSNIFKCLTVIYFTPFVSQKTNLNFWRKNHIPCQSGGHLRGSWPCKWDIFSFIRTDLCKKPCVAGTNETLKAWWGAAYPSQGTCDIFVMLCTLYQRYWYSRYLWRFCDGMYLLLKVFLVKVFVTFLWCYVLCITGIASQGTCDVFVMLCTLYQRYF